MKYMIFGLIALLLVSMVSAATYTQDAATYDAASNVGATKGTDTLQEGETHVYVFYGIEYEITLVWVSDAVYWEESTTGKTADTVPPVDNQPSARFLINGELTDTLYPGESDAVECGKIHVERIGNSVTSSGDQGSATFSFYPTNCNPPSQGDYVKLYEGDVHALTLNGKTYRVVLKDVERDWATFSVYANEYQSEEVRIRTGQYGSAAGLRFHLKDNDYVSKWALIGDFSTINVEPDSFSGTLREGETHAYAWNGREYELTVVFVSDPYYWEDGATKTADIASRPSAKFSLNGEVSDSIHIGEKDELRCGTLKVTKISTDSDNGRNGTVSYVFYPRICSAVPPNDEPDVHIVVGHQAPTSDIIDAVNLARALQQAGNTKIEIVTSDQVNPIAVGLAMLDIDAYRELTDEMLADGITFILSDKHALLVEGRAASYEEQRLFDVGMNYLKEDDFSVKEQSSIGFNRKYLLVANMITLWDDPTPSDTEVSDSLREGECKTYSLIDYNLKVCAVDVGMNSFDAEECNVSSDGQTDCAEPLYSRGYVRFTINDQNVHVYEGGSTSFTMSNFKGKMDVTDILENSQDSIVQFTMSGYRFAPNPGPVACTSDAKMCPDGSYVGRSGPNCEFATCPSIEPDDCDGQWVCPTNQDGTETNCYCLSDVDPAVEECTNGCDLNGKCVDYGTRYANGEKRYCSLDGWSVQKADGNSCQNSYECESNQCLNGQCKSLDKQLEENTSLLNKIVGWFGSIFRGGAKE